MAAKRVAKRRFRHRILLVDGKDDFVRTCSALLRNGGYEVLTANDGFEALCVLRGSHPDMLITELSLPRMSGFELLSIVRTRFPGIAVIAISDDYTPATVPRDAVCDVFLAKGDNVKFELLEQTRTPNQPITAQRVPGQIRPGTHVGTSLKDRLHCPNLPRVPALFLCCRTTKLGGHK